MKTHTKRWTEKWRK